MAATPAYRSGKPALDWSHKISANENPFPPLPAVTEAITAGIDLIGRYPDIGSTRLYEALASSLGAHPDQFAAGSGSMTVLYSLLSAFCSPGDEVVYAWRSFEAYPIAVGLTGARSVQVPLAPDATHDLAAMAAAIGPRTKVVLICTPNNPTGPVVPHEDLERFLGDVPGDVLVVIDEAYVEYVRDPKAARGLDLMTDRPNVLVLRTFSKAYGLAGLRVGFAVGDPAVSLAIRQVTPPFSMSGLAQEAAVAALAHRDELLAQVDLIVAERERVLLAMRRLGLDSPDTHGNFVWLPVGDASHSLAEALLPAVVRVYPGEGVRVTIGEAHINDEVIAACEGWVATR